MTASNYQWLCVAALFAAVCVFAPTPADANAFPSIMSLPAGWGPEGLAAGTDKTLYIGSVNGGKIYKLNAKTGEGAVLVAERPDRIASGLKYQHSTKYLWVAGGPTGKAYVYDADTGADVAELTLVSDASPTNPTLVNDVVLTNEAAYFTDSLRPVLYEVRFSPQPLTGANLRVIPITGDMPFLQGPNILNGNGIEAKNNGNFLIVCNCLAGGVTTPQTNLFNSGLYRVDMETGVSVNIPLSGLLTDMFSCDGLLLEGQRTLYVALNFRNIVAEVSLAEDWSSGEVVAFRTGNGALANPSTLARSGALYAVNSHFFQCPPLTSCPNQPFEVVKL